MGFGLKPRPSPSNATRHVGVELEFDVDNPVAAQVILDSAPGVGGLFTCTREALTYDYAKVMGYEATWCAPPAELAAPLRAGIRLIREAGAYVDERCGLHVHLDFRAAPGDRVAACDALFDAQTKLYSLVHPRRATEREVRPVPVRGSYGRKEAGFWVANKYPTVEVRMHEAVLDADRILFWVGHLHEIVFPSSVSVAA